MLAKLLAFLTVMAVVVVAVGAFFGWFIMIGVGVLSATYGFSTLSFGSSWVLGLCWAILISGATFSNARG